MLSLNVSMIGSYSFNCQIIDQLGLCMNGQMKHYFKSPLKIISNGLDEREKLLDLHH